MPRDAAPPNEIDTDLPLLLGLGAGIIGIGLIVAAVGNNAQRREAFFNQLADGLRAHGLSYVSAVFGRAPGNLPVWNVTFVHPLKGLQSRRVVLPVGVEPYAETTSAAVINEVLAAA